MNIEEELFIGILGLKHPRSKDANLSKKNINKYLGIPNKLINVFYFNPSKSPNIDEKYFSSLNNHINIVRHAYNKGYKYVLVFEDDVEFKALAEIRDIKKIFNSALNKLKEYPSIEKLNFSNSMTPSVKLDKYIYKTDFSVNAHMYILSRQGMKKVLDSYLPSTFKSDKLYIGKYGTLNQFDVRYELLLDTYYVSPQIVYQRRLPAFLKNMKYSGDHASWTLVNESLYFNFSFISIIVLLLSLFIPELRLIYFSIIIIYILIIMSLKLLFHIFNKFKIF